jgi:hypothetical protein
VLLDSGTSKTYLPATQFDALANATFAQPWSLQDAVGSSGYAVSCELAKQSGGLAFAFSGPHGHVTIQVPWKEVVYPDSVLKSGWCVLAIGPADDPKECLFGDSFLRSAYVLYNYDAMTISLAQASYNNSCSDCARALS